jgi:hypothetical protein
LVLRLLLMAPQYGYGAKFYGALDHLKHLAGELAAWVDENSRLTTHRFYPAKREYVVWVTVKEFGSAGLAVEIGECLHDLRSGLDHLAYVLAVRYTGEPLPKKIGEDSEFPIFGDEDRQGVAGKGPTLFKDAARKIAGIDPAAQAVIESLQPYKLGANFRTHELWRLYELARVDRHRLLHLSVIYSGGILWNPALHLNVRAIGPGVIVSHGGEIEPGKRTEIARMPVVPINAKERVYVDIKPALEVVFASDTPTPGEAVPTVLGGIYNYVISNVLASLERFL